MTKAGHLSLPVVIGWLVLHSDVGDYSCYYEPISKRLPSYVSVLHPIGNSPIY